MARNKVFYHTGTPCNGCGGIGDYWRTLDAAGVNFGCYSVEGAGLIVEASQFQHADPLIYRTLATDVAEYALPPNEAAAHTWAVLMERVPPEVHALKSRVWLEVGNEPDKNRADWLGQYYVELASYALANGYRMSAFAWSTGEPEKEHWQAPGVLAYLHLCSENSSRLAVSVHEYSLSADDIMDGYPWLVGRVGFLFDTCKAQGINPPTTFITELGWTHNDLPPGDIAKEDIERVAELYAQYPTVKAAFLWSLMGGGDKKTLAAELNALMGWLTDFTLTTTYPDPDTEPPPPVDPPVEPPDIPMSNLFLNGSFEKGHTDAYNDAGERLPIQIPLGWEFKFDVYPQKKNPFDDAIHSRFGQPECNVLHKSKFPPSEWEQFGLDGEYIYKWFGKAHRGRLMQTIDLPAGDYQVTFPTFADAVMRYENNQKVWATDDRACLVRIKVNNKEVLMPGDGYDIDGEHWFPIRAGRLTNVSVKFTHPGGVCKVAYHLMMPYALVSNGVFVDATRLTAVPVEPPPPPPPPPPPDDEPVTLEDALLAKAETIPPAYYPWHAIPDAAIDGGFYPVAGEFPLTHDGIEYVALKAISNDQRERIYYAIKEDWGNVRWVGDAPPTPPEPKPPVVDDRPIIDISHHQGAINWTKFGPKVAGVIIRLGYGTTEDREARRNVAEATARGVPFAVYHYFVPTVDAKAQANWFGNLAKAIAPGRLCAVDLEEKAGVDSATPTKVKTYLDALETIADHQAMIYTNIDYWANVLKSPAWGIYHPLWIAAWTDASKPIVPKPFVDWDVWQYAVKEISQSEWGVFSERLDFNRLNVAAGDAANFLDDSWYWPEPDAIDMLPYLRGDGRMFEVQHVGAGTETFQTQTDGDMFYLVKNSQWEQLYADSQYIWRGVDTSPGKGRLYIQFEPGLKRARWMPRFMSVGQSWTGPGHYVQFYNKADCSKSEQNSGNATNRMTFRAYYQRLTWNGVTVEDVVELTNNHETWFCARNYGLVSWKSQDGGEMAICQVYAPGERPALVREKINCL